jgi:hypothetical protein
VKPVAIGRAFFFFVCFPQTIAMAKSSTPQAHSRPTYLQEMRATPAASNFGYSSHMFPQHLDQDFQPVSQTRSSIDNGGGVTGGNDVGGGGSASQQNERTVLLGQGGAAVSARRAGGEGSVQDDFSNGFHNNAHVHAHVHGVLRTDSLMRGNVPARLKVCLKLPLQLGWLPSSY